MPRNSQKSRFFHPMVWLLLFIVALIAIWVGVWYYAAGKVEQQVNRYLERSADRGIEITCNNQDVLGFPFRIGLFCDDVAMVNPKKGSHFSAQNLRSAAQIYKPTHMIVELDSPAFFASENFADLEFNWQLFHASLQYDLGGLNDVAGEFDELASSLKGEEKGSQFSIQKGQVFLRKRQQDLETAINFKRIEFKNQLLANLPITNILGQGIYHGLGERFAKGQLQHFDIKEAGLTGETKYLRFEIAKGENESDGDTGNNGFFQIAGPWQVTNDGLLSADVTLTIANAQALLESLSKHSPNMLPLAKTLTQGLEAFGESVSVNGTPAKQIDLKISKNKIRLGFFEIGKLPRLF